MKTVMRQQPKPQQNTAKKPGVQTITSPDTIIAAPEEAAPKTIAELTQSTPLARSLQGEWQIIQVGSVTIDRDEDMPYIVFEPSKASFYANNGCNTLNGAYSVDASDRITFHNVLSTMRLCADVDFDNQINVIIGDNVTTQLRLTEVGQETFVDFVTSSGKTLMRLRRGNLEFLNGNWDVVSIN